MQLLEAIQDLKQLHISAQEDLKQGLDALKSANAQSVVSVKKELLSFGKDLSVQAQEVINQKAQELEENNQKAINEFLSQNLEALAKEGVQKLPLDALSKQISQEFLAQNAENLKVFINESLSSEPYSQFLEVAKQKAEHLTQSFLEEFTTQKRKISECTRGLIYEYLQENEQKIYEQIDFKFLENATLEWLQNNKEMQSFIEEKAKEILKERISFLSTRDEMKKLLEEKAHEAFERALGYEELVEKRFKATLQLAAFHILGELGSLSKILNALSDVKSAEARLKRLKELGVDEAKNMTFKVI